MGTCIYCGKPVGFLRRKHRECEQQRNKGYAEMVSLAKNAAYGVHALDGLKDKLVQIAENSYIPLEEINETPN